MACISCKNSLNASAYIYLFNDQKNPFCNDCRGGDEFTMSIHIGDAAGPQATGSSRLSLFCEIETDKSGTLGYQGNSGKRR
jgi:hypothetical protein